MACAAPPPNQASRLTVYIALFAGAALALTLLLTRWP